ncbi:MAG: twin-arginine translocase subunit TatC [Succinivibrio sp.]
MGSFTDNFLKLRSTVIKMIVVFIFTLAVLSPFTRELFDFAMIPFSSVITSENRFLSVSVTSPVFAPLKVLLFCAFLISLPVNLFLLWRFVAPGLFKKERIVALAFVLISVLMFLAGMVYCYSVVFPLVFNFIEGFAPDSVQFSPDIDESLGFIVHMFMAFGFGFEIPVIVCLLTILNIVKLETLKKKRRLVIVMAFAVSAVVTPPDVTSQLLLAVPAVVLYEAGIIASSLLFVRRKSYKTVSVTQ